MNDEPTLGSAHGESESDEIPQEDEPKLVYLVLSKDKTFSMDEKLAQALRDAAPGRVRKWFGSLTRAARRVGRKRRLRKLVAEWEAEHGAFTQEEMDAARARLRG